MISQTAVVKRDRRNGLDGREPGGSRLRAYHLLVLSLWCGLVAGPLEVGAIVLRKHLFDLNQFYWMSRHFVWLIPLTNLLIFLALGLVLCARGTLAGRPRPLAGGAVALCLDPARTVLGRLPPHLWARRVPPRAGDRRTVGPDSRAPCRRVPPLRHRSASPSWRSSRPLLAASVWVGDWLKERTEAARPLPPAGSPNVMLIVLDTVAAGHLSLHGYDRPTSPTLDGLARRGVRFDRVQATSSWTLPSHASFFTGRWPHELSVGWLTPLDATHPTLAEYLGSRGYATAGFVANTFYCGADTGLGRGFTLYRDYIFPGLSAFKPAALVDRPVEGLRALHHFLRERCHRSSFWPT